MDDGGASSFRRALSGPEIPADGPGKRVADSEHSFAAGESALESGIASSSPAMESHPGLKDARRPVVLMYAFIVLSLLAGLRTEEARALSWQHMSLDGEPQANPPVLPHVAVWRSVRLHSETRLVGHAAPRMAVDALRALRESQEEVRLLADEGRTPGSGSLGAGSPAVPLLCLLKPSSLSEKIGQLCHGLSLAIVSC